MQAKNEREGEYSTGHNGADDAVDQCSTAIDPVFINWDKAEVGSY